MPLVSDTPTTRSCTSSLGLDSIIDLSDDLLFFRPPRPSTTDVLTPPASPARVGSSPPRPPRRRPQPLRKVHRKPVPSFLEFDGSASDSTPPLSNTPSEMSHQTVDDASQSQVSLDITRPRSGYFDTTRSTGTNTPSSKSTLSSLDAELARSTYHHLVSPSSTKPYRPTFPYVSLPARSTISLHSSSTSLPLVKPTRAVEFVHSTLLSSPGVRPCGDGWTGGPQRDTSKAWFSRVRRLSSGSRDKSAVYGAGMGIEHIKKMGGSQPNLPSMTSSRLDLLPPSPTPFTTDLGKVEESPNSPSSNIGVENVGAPEMSRSGTFGTKTKIQLIRSRPEIPPRIKSLSSPRRTDLGTTYDFRESVLAFESYGQVDTITQQLGTGHVDEGSKQIPEPKPLAVLGRLKARMRSGSVVPRPNTPASLRISRPNAIPPPHPSQTKALPSLPISRPAPPPNRPLSRLGAPSTWKSTLSKLDVDKWNRRLSTLTQTDPFSPPPRMPTPPSPRSLPVVSMTDFLSTPPSHAPVSLSLALPAISESINLDDMFDTARRESIVETILSSSSPSSRHSSLATPALDPSSPSVQSEHDIPLVTPTISEQPHYITMMAKRPAYPLNPHLKRVSGDSMDSKASFYTALEGEDVSMIHYEEESV